MPSDFDPNWNLSTYFKIPGCRISWKSHSAVLELTRGRTDENKNMVKLKDVFLQLFVANTRKPEKKIVTTDFCSPFVKRSCSAYVFRVSIDTARIYTTSIVSNCRMTDFGKGFGTKQCDFRGDRSLGNGLDDWGVGVRLPAGPRYFSRPTVGPTQPPIHWVQGALSMEIKGPGREAHSSPSSSAGI